MWRDRAVLRILLLAVVGSLATGVCMQLGRLIVFASAWPQPLTDVMARTGVQFSASNGSEQFSRGIRSVHPVQRELLTAALAAANADGAIMLVTANKAAMLYQAPPFMAALHGQPASQPIADNLIIITFDVVAQRLCARQHRAALCVLDSWETSKLGVEPDVLAEALRGSAAWGSTAFRAMTWRKVELVHDLLLQGFSVLSCDLDITLFRNPLDPQVNPWMRPEVDMIVARDSSVTGMLNCGFYYVRPVASVMEFFRIWVGAAYDAPVPFDVWEQAVFNETLIVNPTAVRWHTLAQTYFGDMCFYFDVRAALVLNSGAILDAHVFGDTFDASMDAFKAWDTMFGFHTPCCYYGRVAWPEPASQECKLHEKPWERFVEQQGSLPADDGPDSSLRQPLLGKPSGGADEKNASETALRTQLPSLEDLEALRLITQGVRDKNKNQILRKVRPAFRRETDAKIEEPPQRRL